MAGVTLLFRANVCGPSKEREEELIIPDLGWSVTTHQTKRSSLYWWLYQ